MPQIYMIAGPNGAGKTTTSMLLLPEVLHCLEYVNADSIAAGLSPFKQEQLAFRAGRLMLERIHELAKLHTDFAFETTASSKSFLPFLQNCKKEGYTINILYLWLKTPQLSLQRIAERVAKGGHNIPENVAKRRYKKSIHNFINLYRPIADSWFVYDNSKEYPKQIAEKENDIEKIYDEKCWHLCLKASK